MTIIFNQTAINFDGNTLIDLLKRTGQDKSEAIVITVNRKIIPEKNWKSHRLEELDVVHTILPIYGG